MKPARNSAFRAPQPLGGGKRFSHYESGARNGRKLPRGRSELRPRRLAFMIDSSVPRVPALMA
jgi:hypothetical protein